MTTNVFRGEEAVRQYLNPDNHPPLPLVELPECLNPYRGMGVRIFLKLMHFLPLANVKSLPAYSMLDEAERDGSLLGVHSLVESSSGNTVLSLAVLGRAFGINTTLALASSEVELGKLQLLRLLGTSVRVVEEDICPDPADPNSGPNQARRMGQEDGWLNPGQYHNLANPKAHERWTGPQIWLQTGGKVTTLAAGLGTTGTLVGTAAYLKDYNPKIRTVGVIREPNNPVPGVRTRTLLNEVNFDWPKNVDELVPIGTRESYDMSLKLCRAGLLVGPSSGFALAGLLTYLSKATLSDLDQARNGDGEVVAVVIAPDSPFPYVEEYFRYLGEDAFPPIEHKHLLRARPKEEVFVELGGFNVDISAVDLLRSAYGMVPDELKAKSPDQPDPMWKIIDVRSSHEFNDHHLPGSMRIDFETLRTHGDIFAKAFVKEGQPVFICQFGGMSAMLATQFRAVGINAYSLVGGTVEWSRLNLPRIKAPQCLS